MTLRRLPLLLLTILLSLGSHLTSALTLSLAGSTKAAGGSPWTLRNHNGSLSLPATVPGVVHLDLLRAKHISEPYYRYGEVEQAWVYLEPSWTFSRTIAAGALGGRAGESPGRVLLRSEGLDTMATVTLNGKLVAETSNMFHRHLWDVTSTFLPAATNTLEVRFDSPARASSAAKAAYPYPVWGGFATPFQYPSCGCPDVEACAKEQKGCECLIKCKGEEKTRMLSTRNFLRKSQAHWGWDWGAGFLTSGIYRELELVSYQDSSVIRDVVVQIYSTSAAAELKLAPGENPTSAVRPAPTSFRVDLDVFLVSDSAHASEIRVAIPSLGVKNTTQLSVSPGEQQVRISLELADVPKSALWYPNGYGAAVLHNLSVAVGDGTTDNADPDNASQSRWVKRIGLKSVELVQAPLPPGLPCGRPDCGAGLTCSDTPPGSKQGKSCAFYKTNGRCNQTSSQGQNFSSRGKCCMTCSGCSDVCLAANGEKSQPGGLSMVFRVNGEPVFIKGANWIATDQFEPRIPQRKGASGGGDYESAGAGFEALLSSAKAAHYNMLRVWGGGTYERDDFYDIADELGMMLWEESKFACALYPRNKQFLESVKTEVEDQTRRLSHHASISVYSGNNENMKPAQPPPGGQGTDQTLIDYVALYDETVQGAIRATDRSRPYWPASPSNGAVFDDPDRGLFLERWSDAGEQDSRYGDVHTYPSFGMPKDPEGQYDPIDCEDLSKFQAARFVSEYGFISMESWASMASMTLPTDLTADGNSSQMFFRMRQSWPNGNRILLGQLGLNYEMPTNPNGAEAFKDLTYLSQAVQAHCVTLASAHFRLQRGSAAGTMGLMFWSLNNQWQGHSDAAVDYTGRYKLLQYAAARYYAPMLLHLHSIGPKNLQNNTNITTGIVNDTPRTRTANITLVLRSWATGERLKSWHVVGEVPAFSSHNFSTAPAATLLGGHAKGSVFLTASAALEGGAPPTALSAHHFFSKMKVAELRNPEISLVFGSGTENLTVTVSCKAPAPHIFLDPGVLLGHFDDNGMLLLPGQPRTLVFDTMGETDVTVERLKAEVVVRSPWSTQHPALSRWHS